MPGQERKERQKEKVGGRGTDNTRRVPRRRPPTKKRSLGAGEAPPRKGNNLATPLQTVGSSAYRPEDKKGTKVCDGDVVWGRQNDVSGRQRQL